MGSYLSILTLNVNGLNAPTKRQRLAERIPKKRCHICCLQETHFKTRDTYRLKVKGWKKIFHTNRDQKKAGVAMLISDKIDFKTKAVRRLIVFFAAQDGKDLYSQQKQDQGLTMAQIMNSLLPNSESN